MYNNRNQGAYSQRYSNYLMQNIVGGRDDSQPDTPNEVPSRTVKVSFNRDMGNVTGNGLENGVLTVKSGDSVTLTATPKSGYRFVKWTGVPQSTKNTDPTVSFNVLKDYSITAVFAIVPNEPLVPSEPQVDPEPVDPEVRTEKTGVKAVLKKYWWVAAILVVYYLYKEGKL